MKILTAEWVLPISSEPIFQGAIVVDKGKILAVETLDKIAKQFPETPTENFGDAVIMPGFVNAHSHLEITAMRGFLENEEEDFYSWLIKLTKTRGEKLSEKDLEISAVFGALEGARAGVTCFADIGRFGKAGFNALKTNHLRGILFQETEFSPRDEEAENAFAVLENKFLELSKNETGLVKIGISPHSPYTVSRKLFEKITKYSIKNGVKLSIHAAESPEEQDFMLNGTGLFAEMFEKFGLNWDTPKVSSVQYLAEIGVLETKPLLAHCVKVSEKDVDTIAKSNSSIAHCPKSNAKFGHGIAPLEKFLAKNIHVGFGSDSVASNNNCDILEEAKFATLAARTLEERKRFLSAKEIIETATLGGASSLGMENEIGTLEAGKQADLIVVALVNAAQMPVHNIYTALLFASNGRDVKMTMVAGEEIYRDGKTLKIDEEILKKEMKKIAGKMRDA